MAQDGNSSSIQGQGREVPECCPDSGLSHVLNFSPDSHRECRQLLDHREPKSPLEDPPHPHLLHLQQVDEQLPHPPWAWPRLPLSFLCLRPHRLPLGPRSSPRPPPQNPGHLPSPSDQNTPFSLPGPLHLLPCPWMFSGASAQLHPPILEAGACEPSPSPPSCAAPLFLLHNSIHFSQSMCHELQDLSVTANRLQASG